MSGLRSTVAACRVIAAIAIGVGGPVGSIVGAKQIQDGAPLTQQTLPPHSSETFNDGVVYVGVFFPKRIAIQNPGDTPMTLEVKESSLGRRVATLALGVGGSLLSLGAAAVVGGARRRRSTDGLEA